MTTEANDYMRVNSSTTVVTAALVMAGVAAPSTAAVAAPEGAPLAAVTRTVAASSTPANATHRLSPRLAELIKPSVRRESLRRQAEAQSVPATGAGSIERTASGRMVVTVRFAHYSTAHVAAVKAAGARITVRSPELRQVTATVAIDQLDAVADSASVQYVGEVIQPQVSATCDSTISGGDSLLKASNERADHSVTGAGVTVGILSDSYSNTTSPTSAAQDVTSDNLPGTTNTCSHTSAVNVIQDESSGGEDEGRAMAQTVHDLAPGAKLAFATAENGESGFAANIKSLANAGAKVIADDVSYFDEPFYQEGLVSEAIDTVKAQGVDYFSSAANNSLQFNGHQVGSYEAVDGYRPTTCPSGIPAGHVDCHSFNASSADPTFGFTSSGQPLTVIMQWAEPWGGVNTDLDLYLVNSAGSVVATSNYTNPGAGGIQEPFEYFQYTPTSGQTYSIVVARKSSAAPATTPRFKLLFAENGYQPFSAMEYSTPTGTDVMGPTAYGHNDGASTMAVGASSTFGSSLDSYSSYGPVSWLYPAVGGSTTALASPTVMAKPDIVASDCALNTFFGSPSGSSYYFCGTSDAAPHAAAAAALLMQQSPTASVDQINTALESTAVPLSGATTQQQGAGLINIDAAGGSLVLASSSTALSASPASPVTYGTSSTLTAQVTGSGATPTGTVAFNVDSGVQTNTVSLVSGSASWNPGALTAGTHSITATYNGDGSHATSSATISFVVNKAAQSIAYSGTVPTTQAVGTTWTPAATGGGSGNTVSFSVAASATNSACTLSAGMVSFAHVGSCVINADQAASSNYNAAPTVASTISVTKGSQAISFSTAAPTSAVKGGNYTPTATGGSSGNTVTFSIDAATTNSACSIGAGNKVSFDHGGSCVVDANQAAGADYTAAPTVNQTFTVGPATGSLAFSSTAPSAAIVGGASYAPTANGSGSSKPIVFSIGAATTNSACTIASGVVSFAHVGSCVVKADQAADADFAAATASQTFSVGKGAQTIAFTSTAPSSPTIGQSYTPTATGGASGNTVVFSVDPTTTASACSLGTANKFSFDHAGSCVIDADQAGATDYTAAPTAKQTITVVTGSGSLTFSSTAPSAAIVGGASYAPTANGSGSSKPIVFSIGAATTNSACTIASGVVSFAHVGSCVVKADQAADADFAAATASQTFSVGKGTQAVSFNTPPPTGATVGGGPYTPTANGGASGSPVTFAIAPATTNSACSLSAGNVSYDHAGTCAIDANQAGGSDYAAAPQVVQSFVIGKAAQAISLTSSPPAGPIVGDSYPIIGSGGGSTNPLTATVDASTTNSACVVAGLTVSFTHVGSCVIDVNQAGNADYAAAPTLTQSATVGKATQSIAFGSDGSGGPVGGSVTPTATGGGSTNPVIFSVDPSTTNAACTINGSGVVSFHHVGACVIAAAEAGNSDYTAASTVTETFAVTKGTQTVVITSAAPTPVVGQTYSPAATGGPSANPVTFSVDPTTTNSACTISGAGLVTFGHAGNCVIAADEGASTDYTAAPTVTQAVAVGAAATHLDLSVQATTVTAGVTVVAPGSGTPSGLVTFYLSGSPVGAASLSGGAAVITYTVPSGDAGQLSASYAGNGDFTGSSTSLAVTNPTITAAVTSAAAKTKYEWYRSAVQVTFTCHTNSAPLTAPCPAPASFTANGAGQSLTKTILATDGGAASVTVSGINLDTVPPTVKVKGVKNGASYKGKGPKPTCAAKDKLSGVATCKLKLTPRGHVVHYTAVATDKAGNEAKTKGSYHVSKI